MKSATMMMATWMKSSTLKERQKLAKKIGIHPNYLYQICQDRCSAGLAKKIEKATKVLTPDRIVPKYLLRPDIWKKGE